MDADARLSVASGGVRGSGFRGLRRPVALVVVVYLPLRPFRLGNSLVNTRITVKFFLDENSDAVWLPNSRYRCLYASTIRVNTSYSGDITSQQDLLLYNVSKIAGRYVLQE